MDEREKGNIRKINFSETEKTNMRLTWKHFIYDN